MKKYRDAIVVAIIWIVILTLKFTGVVDIFDYIPGNRDIHDGERPIDYIPSKWVSEEPNIWFEVDELDEESVDEEFTDESISTYGEMELNGEIIKIVVYFNMADMIFIYEVYETGECEIVLQGRCKFGSDKMVVEVDKEYYDSYEGKYEEITFIRESN